MRIRLSQPPAGDWLAGAWAELGKNYLIMSLVRKMQPAGLPQNYTQMELSNADIWVSRLVIMKEIKL